MVNLASDIPVIAQWGHEMCGQSSMDGAYAWAQQQGLALVEAELVQPLLCLHMQAVETSIESLIHHLSQR